MSKLPNFNQLSANKLFIFSGYFFAAGSVFAIFGLVLIFSQRSVVNSQIARKVLPSNSENKLTLLGDTFSGYSTFRSREFQQSLKEQQIELNYVNEPNQARRAELLNLNHADLLVTSLDQFIKQQPQGKIIGLIDRTVGADAVVLNNKKYPQLRSLLDLKAFQPQQKLGITFAGDTPSEFITLVLGTKFEAFDLARFQVSRVEDAVDAWKQLQDPNRAIAVAVLWEPYVTKAKQLGYNVVLSSKDAPDPIVDVIVASDRLLQNRALVANFLATYYKQVDPRLIDATGLRAQIAEDGNLSTADAETIIQGIDFFTALEAREWLTTDKMKTQINETAAVLTLAGKIKQIPSDPIQLYDSQSIHQAANNTEHLLNLVRHKNLELANKLNGKERKSLGSKSINASENIGNLQLRGEVNFKLNSGRLDASSQQEINRLAKEISRFNPETVGIRVIGHASSSGNPAYNLKLSNQRAQAVVLHLRRQGIQHQVEAVGKGSSQPLAGIAPSDRRNQYTEIRLVRLK